jgi:cytosine/adenosine deaminase-related metal-dependent hydrolase
MGLKARRKNEIDFRVGAYSPLGFRDDEPERWALLTRVAREADFLGSLPERDDKRDYPEHIGFDENCRRMLLLSAELDKQLHVHVDQQDHAFEDGCERVARLTRELGLGVAPDREPRTWLIHAISPSAYDEERFEQLIEALAELNIGIICCPSAAISMRQIRPLMAPTHNSMARVLEMLAAGIQVRVGSDNICDITSPASTTDLVDELFVLSNAVRYYDVDILAKIGAGVPLDATERGRLKVHLDRDFAAAARVAKRYEDEALELSPLS